MNLSEISTNYQNETLRLRDPERAIATAKGFAKEELEGNSIWVTKGGAAQSVHWLCQAKTFLGDKPLSDLIDLDHFFKPFHTISATGPFASESSEISDAIGRSRSIKVLTFLPDTEFSLGMTKKIADVLTKTKSIHTLEMGGILGGYRTGQLDNTLLAPIAKALETNTSLFIAEFYASRIDDEGVFQIANALEKNPKSNLKSLNLACSQIGEKGAEALTKLPQFRQINVIGFKPIPQSIQNLLNEMQDHLRTDEIDE